LNILADYKETTEPISAKLGGRVGHGTKRKWLSYGADPIKVVDPGSFFALSLTLTDRPFSTFNRITPIENGKRQHSYSG